MTLDEAVARIEAKFPPVEGLPISVAQTGEHYLVFDNGGAHRPGDNLSPPAWSEEQAVHDWFEGVLRYAAGRAGNLYWRTKPEAQVCTSTRGPAYLVYSRLLISDGPTVYADLTTYESLHPRKADA